jgi:magnesium chelatase subunit D
MSETMLNLKTPLVRILACVALNPGLRSVLFRDINPVQLLEVADILVSMLVITTRRKIKLVVLGASHTEDDLWGYNTLRSLESHQQGIKQKSQLEVCWQPGLLDHRSSIPNQPDMVCLVLIPDLSEISLAAARACVALNSAEIAHLERHGRQDSWSPNICWLAGYSDTNNSSVTRHILDRFALRLQFAQPALDLVERANLLRSWHQNNVEVKFRHGQASAGTMLPLPAELRASLQRAGDRWVVPSDESLLDNLANRFTVDSLRHAIGLARLSYTLAQLDDDTLAIHFDQAAQLIHLDGRHMAPESRDPKTSQPDATVLPPVINPEAQQSSSSRPLPNHMNDSTSADPLIDPSPIKQADKLLIWSAVPMRLPDQVLRSPSYGPMKNATGGEIIGTEQITAADKLAIVPTIIEAARFTPWRRAQRHVIGQLGDTHGLIIMPLDLRGYRRARTRQVLLLVIDYTSLYQANWEQILADYLNWSYRTHADVLVIQVGVGAEPQAFRAHMVNVRSPLASRVQMALAEQPGYTTPLAHGLYLALQALDRELRHRRGVARALHLIVASDGRGNVRLADSHDQQIRRPIKDEGFTDALEVAQRLGELQRLSSHLTITFLDPQPQAYRDLPLKLAAALRAELVKIPAPRSLHVSDDLAGSPTPTLTTSNL